MSLAQFLKIYLLKGKSTKTTRAKGDNKFSIHLQKCLKTGRIVPTPTPTNIN